MDLPPKSEAYQTVEALDLCPIKAGQVMTDALKIVNSQLKDYQIVYTKQPCGGLRQTDNHLRIAPSEPLDLAIEYPDHLREGIDFINVVHWVSYDSNQGRLTSGFKTPESLAEEILAKLEQHLEAKKNPHILISSEGSKYDTKLLTENKVSIDEQGYLRVNNLRLWSQKRGPLLAASFRGCEVIVMKELKGRIELSDESDPAPTFYIDLHQRFRPENGVIPDDKKSDAMSYQGDYLLLLREPGKI